VHRLSEPFAYELHLPRLDLIKRKLRIHDLAKYHTKYDIINCNVRKLNITTDCFPCLQPSGWDLSERSDDHNQLDNTRGIYSLYNRWKHTDGYGWDSIFNAHKRGDQ